MARLVYACRFDVVADDAIRSVLFAYKSWIVDHYRRRHDLHELEFDPETDGSTEPLPVGHSLNSSVYKNECDRVVRIRWSTPDDTDVGLRWANEVRIGEFGNRCGVEHLIMIESVEYNLAPARLLFGSPRVVREICKKSPSYIGEMQIRAEPYALKQDGLNDLIALLTSDLRKLPVVLLSPYARGDFNLIDPAVLAQKLAGVAVVVRIDDPELTWDFADEVGRRLSCFDGGARIYWPGFSNESDPRSHRLLFGAWIEQVGAGVAARTIERAIFAVAAFRYVPDKRIADLIRIAEASQRQQVLDQKRQAGDEFWDDYQQTVDKLREAEERLIELEAENATFRVNQQVLFTVGPDGPDELTQNESAEELALASVSDAVRAAASRCKNLIFLDTAMSAAEACPFQRPFDVFKALTDLDEIVDVWSNNRAKNGTGGDLLQHLRERGWAKRSSMKISDTTRGKFRSAYEFEHDGKKQLFEPHITIGSGDANVCASIHFIFDQKQLKIVIGHVGRHLQNTKT